MGLSPIVFGRHGWRWIHLLAITFPENPNAKQKEDMQQLLKYFFATLPCPACAYHAQVYVTSHSPAVNNRMEFISWVNDFHNNVNKRLKKTEYTIEESIEETKKYFFKGNDWDNLPVYEQWRREDNRTISMLKNQLDSQQGDTEKKIRNMSIISTVQFVIIFVLLLLIMYKTMRNYKKTIVKEKQEKIQLI